MNRWLIFLASTLFLVACGDDNSSSAPVSDNGNSDTAVSSSDIHDDELSSAADSLKSSSSSTVNSLDESVSSSSKAKEPVDPDHFVDSRDGRTYKVAHIFTQSWMAENLNYDDGESTCIYWNPENCEDYGRFYTWESAMKSCPEGWRLPTRKDWMLIDKETWRAGYYEYTGFLTSSKGLDGAGLYGFGAHFTGIDTVGTDTLGEEGWRGLNYSVYFWVGEELDENHAAAVEMNKTNSSPTFLFSDMFALPSKSYRLPVRCIKETEGTMKDSRDGQTYRTIVIGNQVWMGENLNYKTDSSRTLTGEEKNPHRYGQLYTYSDAEKVCPSGWHLPSAEEWQPLLDLVDDFALRARLTLKSAEGWDEYTHEDDYGFTAYPSGSIHDFGGMEIDGSTFLEYNDRAVMWVMTPEYNEKKTTLIISDHLFGDAELGEGGKFDFNSVRCILD